MENLECGVRHYAWGDLSFLPELRGEVADGRPAAEMWMGAHPGMPSHLADGTPLGDAIGRDPLRHLGPEAAGRFGELPYLAKILAASSPLSIQVHPNSDQARRGFEREERAAIPIDGPSRTYRDPFHKPEIICALTTFEAKRGFRDLDATRELMASLDDRRIAALRSRLDASGEPSQVLADVVRWLLTDPAGGAVADGVAAAAAETRGGPYGRELAWTPTLAAQYPSDPGLAVALLLNHVSLDPGEAIYLQPGTVHAYLTGAGVEVMANSDNVVRCGLTPKHVDVDELMAIADFRPEVPFVQQATGGEHTYVSPVPEFALTRIQVDGTHVVEVAGPRTVVVTKGRVRGGSPGDLVELGSGVAWFVPANSGPLTLEGVGEVFCVTPGRCLYS